MSEKVDELEELEDDWDDEVTEEEEDVFAEFGWLLLTFVRHW